MELRLFNTLGRQIQPFVPIQPGKVGMYACGLTVYGYAHVGNLRTYITEDVLRKTLESQGFDVRHVMNVTDVGHLTDDADDGEDKMVKGARERGKTVWEIADFFTKAFFSDFEAVHCRMPTVVCKATDHIPDMIALIQRLEQRGYTYLAGGNVFFDISKFPTYGQLALLDQQDLRAGARIEVDQGKRNPADFALWFTRGKFEQQSMLWDSPWGKGYPGWHIECSAMSMKYLGEQFDIHCGGIDHVPVHHTNEIAQSEAATGKKWVNYWVHGEWLLMDRAKMARSSGHSITLATVRDKGFDPLDLRYLCLNAHYRTQLAFTWEAMEGARAARQGLLEKVAQLRAEAGETAVKPQGATVEYLDQFQSHILDDLNTPRCLADLWTLVRDTSVPAPQKLAAAIRMDGILELGLGAARAREVELDSESQLLLQEREKARKSRDFKRADEIRAQLLARGIEIQDSPSGPKLRTASGRKVEKTVTSDDSDC